LAGTGLCADQPATKNKEEAQKHTANKPVAPEAAKTAARASTTRLPAGFGKANLSAEQHQKMTAIMEKYAAEMKPLEAQLRDLRTKRDGELNALLTEAQQKAIAEYKANAQKARAERAARQKNPVSRKSQIEGLREQALKGIEKIHLPPSIAAAQQAAEANATKAKEAKPAKEQPKAQSKEQSKEKPSQPEKTEKK
jgi:hypothetical protein